MYLSLRGKKLIQDFEKCKLAAYTATDDEKVKGIWTIGWGNTLYLNGNHVKQGDKITQDQADKLFDSTIAEFENDLTPMLHGINLNQNQYDALISIAYNIGKHDFVDSTLLRQLKQGNFNTAANQFLVWNHQAGKVLDGLTRRRVAERDLFNREESS